MGEVSTIGLDIAKSVFQVHGVDDAGAVVIRKRISRAKVLEFFAALVAVPGRDRSLPVSTSLGPRAAGAWSHGAADAAELCEGLSQAQQERRERCGGDLRGGDAAIDAICADEVRTATVGLDVASQPAASGASTHDAVERYPRTYGRARHHLSQGSQWHGRLLQIIAEPRMIVFRRRRDFVSTACPPI